MWNLRIGFSVLHCASKMTLRNIDASFSAPGNFKFCSGVRWVMSCVGMTLGEFVYVRIVLEGGLRRKTVQVGIVYGKELSGKSDHQLRVTKIYHQTYRRWSSSSSSTSPISSPLVQASWMSIMIMRIITSETIPIKGQRAASRSARQSSMKWLVKMEYYIYFYADGWDKISKTYLWFVFLPFTTTGQSHIHYHRTGIALLMLCMPTRYCLFYLTISSYLPFFHWLTPWSQEEVKQSSTFNVILILPHASYTEQARFKKGLSLSCASLYFMYSWLPIIWCNKTVMR